MSLYKTRAIVIKAIRYKEADKILTILSPEGQIGVIAKGSRKVKSRFGGHIELFSVVDLVLYKGKNLHTVTQANLVKSNRNIREDFSKYLIASGAAELVNKVTSSGQKEETIFNFLEKFLSHLSVIKDTGSLLLPYFDWKIIKILGLLPQLKNSANNELVWLNLAEGCFQDRAPSNNSGLGVKSLTMGALKSIININLEELSNLECDKVSVRQLSMITERYVDYQLHIKLKSRSYIE